MFVYWLSIKLLSPHQLQNLFRNGKLPGGLKGMIAFALQPLRISIGTFLFFLFTRNSCCCYQGIKPFYQRLATIFFAKIPSIKDRSLFVVDERQAINHTVLVLTEDGIYSMGVHVIAKFTRICRSVV